MLAFEKERGQHKPDFLQKPVQPGVPQSAAAALVPLEDQRRAPLARRRRGARPHIMPDRLPVMSPTVWIKENEEAALPSAGQLTSRSLPENNVVHAGPRRRRRGASSLIMNMHGARAGDGDVKSALPTAYLEKVLDARTSPPEMEITRVRCPWDDDSSTDDDQDSSSDDADSPISMDEGPSTDDRDTKTEDRRGREEAAPPT